MANPFDQFSSELTQALPPGANPGGAPGPPPAAAPPPFGASPAPPMNTMAPPMQGGGPPPQPGYSPYGVPSNPYGMPPAGMPPAPPPPSDPFSAYGQQPPTTPSSMPPAAPEPAALTQAPAMANPFDLAPVPLPAQAQETSGRSLTAGSTDAGAMYGAPPPEAMYGAPPPEGQPPQPPAAGYGPTPFGSPDPAALQPDAAGALVPAPQQSNPYAQPNPYGAPPQAYGAPPPGQPSPYGAPPPYGMHPGQPNPYGAPPPYGHPYGAPPPQPPPPAPVDPFSVFESQSKPPEPAPTAIVPAAPMGAPPPPGGAPAAPTASVGSSDDDFWGSFSAPAPAAAVAPEAEAASPGRTAGAPASSGDLPPGGEWYDAKIFTPTLGVMFFKPQELTDSLFLNTDKSLVNGLAERPVVAFIVEGSSARSAGVELGHVLLKVNGVDVKNPKDASRLIKEGPRPLPLLFYVPNCDVVVAEGEHMVKYDTRETTAPNSAKDWKPKYVVIGGIIAQPWMMNMYRSKSEYDIAVIETQARRPVSVKVKQFSLQGARIQNDWQGPQMVKYKNKLHPWKYIVVLPVARNPIKISSPNLSTLKPVHEGIRRVLLAQQRDRGGGSSRDHQHSSPSRNDYRSSGGGDGYARDSGQHQNGYAADGQHHAPPPPQHAGYVQGGGQRY